jgi:nitroreductase
LTRSDAVGFPPGPIVVLVEAVVDPDHDAEFNAWYENEHLPDVLNCPGFRAAARYRRVGDDKYLALYVADDESALETAEVKAISGFAHLTPFVQHERRVYRQLTG